jgi:hypothetical protein
VLHILSNLIKNNEQTFIEYLAVCLIAIYNAKRSIEDEMVTVDDIYRQTAIDILRETTIFSIKNKIKFQGNSEGLSFRNMYFFFQNEYKNRTENRSHTENLTLRTPRNPRKLSLEEPLFDVSFKDFDESDSQIMTVEEESDAKKTITQIINGTVTMEGTNISTVRKKKKNSININAKYDDDNLNIYENSNDISRSSLIMTSKQASKK